MDTGTPFNWKESELVTDATGVAASAPETDKTNASIARII
jgi:hypothetical protein